MARSKSHIRLYLLGWHGQGALGDDLLALCTRDLFETAAARRQVTVEWVRRPTDAHYILIGGGTLLGVDNLCMLDQIRCHGRPYSIFGTGFRREVRALGPRRCKDLKALVAGAEYAFVRGYSSCQFCIHNGTEGVSVIGDPALSFTGQGRPMDADNRFRLGISIRSMDSQSEPQYTDNDHMAAMICDIIGYLCDGRPSRLYFFHLAENIYDSDMIAIDQVVSALPPETTYDIVPITTGTADCFSTIAGMDYLVSQRLHPSIVAWSNGIPHVTLDYQNCKSEDFLSSIGMLEFGLRTDEFSIETYGEKHRRLMRSYDIVARQATRSVAYWRHRQQAAALDIVDRAMERHQ